MDCNLARSLLLDRRRGTPTEPGAEPERAALEEHLEGCPACRQEDLADRELSILLEERLPRTVAPASLRRAIEARLAQAGPEALPAPRPSDRARARPTLRRAAVGLAAAAALALALVLVVRWRPRPGPAQEPMITEAVNDYLRVVYSEHPLEIASGGIHQVKPWFEGRLDFAPVVPFAGDDDFPLQGGAIAYFLDRKAATFVFKRRLHTITLFVFRSEGLPWPTAGLTPVGHAQARLETSRGFHALLWHEADLGYALVSDVDPRDLVTLGGKIAP
jgi:anti-sigma factor RsiW